MEYAFLLFSLIILLAIIIDFKVRIRFGQPKKRPLSDHIREIVFVADPVSFEAREWIKIDPDFGDKVGKAIAGKKPGSKIFVTLCNGEVVKLIVI